MSITEACRVLSSDLRLFSRYRASLLLVKFWQMTVFLGGLSVFTNWLEFDSVNIGCCWDWFWRMFMYWFESSGILSR